MMNKNNLDLSPTSSLRLNFDKLTPETDDPDPQKLLWGLPVPPFMSDKVVSWIEDGFNNDPLISYNGQNIVKKVKSLIP